MVVEKCHYCDKPSKKLCDCIVSFDPLKTCDRHLCDDHAKREGSVVACRRGHGGCDYDTVDKCPEHVGKKYAISFPHEGKVAP